MIDRKCVEHVDHSRIRVEEKGKSAVILNPNREPFLRVQVDGCVQMDGVRADWAVEKGRETVLIELKGGDVTHGADQILATARRWNVDERRCDRLAGLIVGRQSPQSNATMQLKRQTFARQFRGPLHVVGHNDEYEWDALFGFQSPLKRTARR